VRVIVDLVACQGFAQCVFAAPEVFRLRGAESLEFDYEPDDGQRERVEQAVVSCPVRAIRIGRAEDIERSEGS
jgi:ferredoxin